jgi:acetyl esterase
MNYQHKYLKYKHKFLQLSEHPNKNFDYNDLLEPNTKDFIASLEGSTPIYQLGPVKARTVLNNIQLENSSKVIDNTEDWDIKFGDQSVSITIFRPKNTTDKTKLNAVMYFHGGGWILGDRQAYERLVGEIATKANVAVVFVNYTLAPEAKYPVQLDQCYFATQYIQYNGHIHNLDADKLVLIGDSVGGNMVAAVTYLIYTNGDPMPHHQILLYPVTDASMSTKSYHTYENGPWLTKKSMEWFFDAYITDKSQRTDPTISPLNIPTNILENFPPALVITDENDVLRDEGEAYAHKMQNAGVNVTAVRYLGTVHDFLMLNSLQDTPAAVNARSLIIDRIKKVLEKN